MSTKAQLIMFCKSKVTWAVGTLVVYIAAYLLFSPLAVAGDPFAHFMFSYFLPAFATAGLWLSIGAGYVFWLIMND